MTLSGYIRCEVCNKVTQIKLELNYTSSHYRIYIPCKNCDTLFIGNYIQDDEKVEVSTSFVNATKIKVPEDLPNYICTITQDFFSNKVKDISCAEDTITFPKWMSFSNRLGHENIQQIFYNINCSQTSSQQAIFEWSRVLNLWYHRRYGFLKSQLEYFFDESPHNIKLNNKQNYLSAIRKLTTNLTNSLFFNNEYDDFYNKIVFDMKKVTCTPNIKPFIKKIGDLDLFIPIEKIISERIISFFQYIEDFTPIFTMYSLSEQEIKDIIDINSPYGVFTTSFDRIKSLYVDLFESTIKTLVIPIGLNNILKRGAHDNFVDSKIKDIEAFQKIDKAFERLKYLEAGNPFSFDVELYLNNKLRNSIGHCSYNISNLNQSITYDRGKKQISLCQTLFETYKMFLYLLKTFYVVTLLHEAYYEFSTDNSI